MEKEEIKEKKEETKEESIKKEKFNFKEKLKDPKFKALRIIGGILVLALIVFILYEIIFVVHPQDKYETIVHQDKSYIQYHFKFDEAMDKTREYNIKEYKIKFNLSKENTPNYVFNGGEPVETIANEYDVYYLVDKGYVIIIDYTDFSAGMHIATSEGMQDISKVINGAFTFKNIKIEDGTLSFDVENWRKDDYIVVTPNKIFSAYYDKYSSYVKDDYAIEISYKYDLSKEEFTSDNFEKTTTKTIKELYDEIKDLEDINKNDAMQGINIKDYGTVEKVLKEEGR